MPKLIISLEGASRQEVELTKERTTIGRRPYNDIVIDNLAVSGEHAVFVLLGPSLQIEDLHSTNGTYVNGRAVHVAPLQPGDLIEIGRCKLQVEGPLAPPPPTPEATALVAGRAAIRVLSGPSSGREMALTKVVTTLGKPGVAVAAITQHPHGHTIALVEGTEPPTVNSRPLGSTPQPLHDQDIITLAGTQMQFLCPPQG